MACELKNLKVKKVSFVKRGANRKQFFLAKSADYQDPDLNNNNSGGTTVRPEIKAKVAELLKEGSKDKVVDLLKADSALKVSDAEVQEITDFLSCIPEPPKPVDNTAALKKMQDDLEAEQKKNADLLAKTTALEEARHRDEVQKWIETECPFLNMKASEAVDKIMKAEKVDKDTAEALKQSFKSISDTVKNSDVLKEYGRSGENSSGILSSDIAEEVSRKKGEIQKSAQGMKESDMVKEAINSLGARRLLEYRKEHIRRAKAAE